MSSTLTIAIVIAAVLAVVLLIALRKRPELPRDSQIDPGLPAPTSRPALREGREVGPQVTIKPRGRDVSDATSPIDVDSDVLATPPPPPPKAREVETGRAARSAEDVASLKKGLASTRGGFVARLSQLFRGKKEIEPGLLDEIEEVLITADIGVSTTQRILDRLRDRMSRRELTDEDRVWGAIREEASAILERSGAGLSINHRPAVILVVGVNGVGKTTTTGKLASRLSTQGKKVVLAAADTFRAAAVLQLEVWGKRIGCPVVRGKENADPSSVVFDAVRRAETEEADVLLIDTAGRLHTKAPLMEELKKIGRTVEKALGRPADEVLLVLDATNGQNALQQAALFREVMPISGIVLTKLDGTAKGGVVLGIVDQHKLPIRYVGIGERVEDLREFDPQSFVEALFERTESEPSAA
ncbi:MAG: Signal recognition particle receptor protein FtsY [Myxococcaceae bacterium]|nr:Signal recognition particle receptor protein FtsY [Myxococcaceae bacterium]